MYSWALQAKLDRDVADEWCVVCREQCRSGEWKMEITKGTTCMWKQKKSHNNYVALDKDKGIRVQMFQSDGISRWQICDLLVGMDKRSVYSVHLRVHGWWGRVIRGDQKLRAMDMGGWMDNRVRRLSQSMEPGKWNSNTNP